MPDPNEAPPVKTDRVSYDSLMHFIGEVDKWITVDKQRAVLSFALALTRFQQIFGDTISSTKHFKNLRNRNLIVSGDNKIITTVPLQDIYKKLHAQSKLLILDLVDLTETRVEHSKDFTAVRTLHNALTLIGGKSPAVTDKRLQTVFLSGVALSFDKVFSNLETSKQQEVMKIAKEQASHLAVFSSQLTSEMLYNSLRALESDLGARSNAITLTQIPGLPRLPLTSALDRKNLETCKNLFLVLKENGRIHPEVISDAFGAILKRAAIQRANAGQFESAEIFLVEAKNQASALKGEAAKISNEQINTIFNQITIMRATKLLK